MKVFGELLSSRMLIISVTALCVWLLADPLITVWLGPEYVMGKTTLLMIVMGFFVGSCRGIIQSFVDAHGEYRDIWAPLAEFVMNVGFSILGGWLWGLDGILGGAMLSQIIIGLLWKPYFLFRWVMKEPMWPFILLFVRYLSLLGLVAAVVLLIYPLLSLHPSASLLEFLLDAVIVFVLCTALMGGIMYILDANTRGFVSRIIKTLSTK
jgi:O-antigen/teichoic acid export membrane protein